MTIDDDVVIPANLEIPFGRGSSGQFADRPEIKAVAFTICAARTQDKVKLNLISLM